VVRRSLSRVVLTQRELSPQRGPSVVELDMARHGLLHRASR
jgi:hypothetical protein